MFAEHYTTTIGMIEITVAPPEQQPWDADVIVEEQDTSLLLGNTHIISATTESYKALIRKMQGQSQMIPGQVIVKHTIPKRFVAIIYDISKKPGSRTDWIVLALDNLLHEMETFQARYVVMPLLGVMHGRFPVLEFMDMFCATLQGVQTGYPEKLWLVTPVTEYQRIIAHLENRQRY